MRLYLIRHGQTTGNLSRRFTGQTDVMLTDLGRQQAAALEPVLKSIPFDRVYSSDLSRAVDTQRLALPGAEGIRLPILREFDTGALTGQNIDAFVAKYGPTGADYSRYGGEDPDKVCQRLRKFLSMLEANPCENVAAFVHNGVMKCMLQLVTGAPFRSISVINDNCNIAVFEYKAGTWYLQCWNYGNK